MLSFKPIKSLFTLILLLAPFIHGHAWQNNTLYFFRQASDSLVGVKDQTGRVIIQARYKDYLSIYTDTTAIEDSIIVMMDVKWDTTKTAQSYGDAYDRRGNFLYHPLFFDNGPDYFAEELTRCVADGKVGFANRQGKIVIKPGWDWVSPFNYGYAFVCNGCYWDRSVDEEHPPLAFRPGADSLYIRRNGRSMLRLIDPASSWDLSTDGGYLPYPFVNTEATLALKNRFDKTEVLHRIAYANYADKRTGRDARLQFEVLESPGPSSPFYLVQAYDWAQGNYYRREDMTFTVDQQGQWFHNDPFQGMQPYTAWLQQELEACKAYFKEQSRAPNKFDLRPYLNKK